VDSDLKRFVLGIATKREAQRILGATNAAEQVIGAAHGGTKEAAHKGTVPQKQNRGLVMSRRKSLTANF
jgi:hypothetical protein